MLKQQILNSLWWPIYTINSVDKTKIFLLDSPPQCSTTVSLETYPIYSNNELINNLLLHHVSTTSLQHSQLHPRFPLSSHSVQLREDQNREIIHNDI